MFLFGGSEPAPVGSSCMSGGKRRTMRRRRSMRSRACRRCHHRPCTCKKSRRYRGGAKKSMKKRSMKKRSMKKRAASKTRPGRLDFVTHKGDKDYNARGHRQVRANAPYQKGGKRRSHRRRSHRSRKH